MERQKEIVWCTDEDLIQFDIDPKKVTDEQFNDICEVLADNLDSHFQDSLDDAITSILGEDKSNYDK